VSEKPICIQLPQHPPSRKAWCGRDVSLEFHFQGLDHAAASVLAEQGFEICSGCVSKVRGVFVFEGRGAGGDGGTVIIITGKYEGAPPQAKGGRGGD
jgi:hypothetical protein